MSAFKFQWVPHNGGPMPVSAETLVEVRFRGYGDSTYRARFFAWYHNGALDDIIAYRVVEVRP